ncbi:MAG TPA: DUF1573 domain-containing protein [Thermoanaerobaculia bacterium]
MKRFLSMVFTLTLIAIASVGFAQETPKKAAAKADAPKGAPKLTLLEPLKDFGTVAKGEKIDWTFEVKNTGTADLEILSASPSCGCTVAAFDKIVKPGATGKVSTHLDTNLAGMGPVSKYVTLQTNDPNTPAAQLTIHLVVKPYVEAHPAGFVRYSILQGDAQTQIVTLYSEEEEPFEIVRVEPPGDYVKVNFKKIENEAERAPVGRPSQNQYRLEVTLGGPTVQIGPLAEKLKIVTNSKHQPEYLLTLTGIVRPTYNVMPTVLNFGEITPGDESATRTIVLQSNNKQALSAFKVTKVESSNPGIVTEAKPSEAPGVYEVIVKVAKADAGELSGDLKIYTTDDVIPVYTLPIKGTVKKPTT